MDGNYPKDDFNNFPFGNQMDQPGGPPPSHGDPGSQLPSQRQVQMWQEQSYMGLDSGFITPSSTQANSITGHGGDMEDGGGAGCYTGPGSIVSGGMSLFDLDSGAPSGKFFCFLHAYMSSKKNF